LIVLNKRYGLPFEIPFEEAKWDLNDLGQLSYKLQPTRSTYQKYQLKLSEPNIKLEGNFKNCLALMGFQLTYVGHKLA
jgi:hypothetical protein